MRTMRIVVCLCLVPPLALLPGCGGSAPPPAQLPVVTIAAGVPGQTIHLCVGQSAELYLHPGVGVAYDCVMDPDDVLAFAYAGSPFNGGEGWAWTALKPGTVTVLVRYTVIAPPFEPQPFQSFTVVVTDHAERGHGSGR